MLSAADWSDSQNSTTIIVLFDNEMNSSEVETGDINVIVSDYVLKLFVFINHVIIDMFICMFGIVGNCINITVFLKQGLRKSVNLSLFAMSTSDLIGLIFQVWHNFCLNPYLEEADLPLQFLEVQILTAGCPNILMTRLTAWITVYITAERCLSVLVPLKIRHIITFKRSFIILVFIFSVNISVFLPIYCSAYLGWKFYPSLNETKLGIAFREDWQIINVVINSAHFYLTLIAFVLVIIFTIILVISLRRKSKWRQGVTSNREQREALTSRQSKTVRMIVVVASILICCYAPGVLSSILTVLVDEFGLSGRESNLFNVVWSFCFIFQSINASINVLMYYRMSSKFRTTFQEIFPMFKNKQDCNEVE